jgi:hypothetical protein
MKDIQATEKAFSPLGSRYGPSRPKSMWIHSDPDPQPFHFSSVSDPGCLSRSPDPEFYPSRIPDPKTATKERGEKISCQTFLCSHKFHKIVNYFSFKVRKKKMWANFQTIIELFIKNFTKL